MVFSSTVFLFLFLPLVLGLHFLAPGAKLRNLLLLIASLLFYAWGERTFTLIIIISIVVNYCFGLGIESFQGQKAAKFLLAAAIISNLAVLAFFKYANFLVDNFNVAIIAFHLQPISLPKIHLPAGISFFTFHALSYVIDIYRQSCSSQKNPVKLALYFDFFPQLIAGPIIRYHDIESQLGRRMVDLDDFAVGVRRFVIGLGKKMLLANTLAEPVDKIFAIPVEHLTPGLAWLGLSCYTMQIYFDFSGYSDMAIGLARMFGFHFPENFNYPYIAQSIRDFWRRWHITLSSWFRDYLYIPLGGNRHSPLRTQLNLIIVFLLCGLWHGASWNFIIWGLLHGIFLAIERQRFMNWLEALWLPLKHLYVLLIVMVAWVFFRSDTFPHAISFLKAMMGIFEGKGLEYNTSLYLNSEVLLALFAGVLASTPILPLVIQLHQRVVFSASKNSQLVVDGTFHFLSLVMLAVVFTASAMRIAAGTYNPFIYFRF